MSLHTLHRLADIAPAAWDALLPEAQPFLRHAFLAALEDSGSVGVHTGWQPAHRLLRDAAGEVRAALPAYIKEHSFGEYVFDMGWAEACQRAGIAYYPKLLGAVPFSPVSGPRLLGDPQQAGVLLDELTASLAGEGLSGLHVNFLRAEDDALFQTRDGWLQRLDCQYHWRNRGYRDFQDFLDSLNSRKRKQLRKEREQVAGQGIDFRWQLGAELREADWDFVYACYASTYHVRRRSPYLTRAFFSLLAERMPEAIRVVSALQHGRPVAMAFSLVAGERFYGRYWGCLGPAFRDLLLPGYRARHRRRPAVFRCRRAGRAQADPRLRTGHHALLALPAAPGAARRGGELPGRGAAGAAGLCRAGAAAVALSPGRSLR